MTAQDAVSRGDLTVAVAEAIGSVRVDGIEPGPVALDALARVARGEIGFDDAVSEVLAPYRRP